MTDTVLGWLVGGWRFGSSSREASGRGARDREASSADAAPRSTAAAIGDIAGADLIARVRAGDHEAFGVLYDALFPALWRIAVFRTRDAEAAKDIVHDVFLSLWTRRETLNAELDLRSYCAAAVRNQVRNFHEHTRVAAATEAAVTQARLDPPGMGHAAPSANAAAESRELDAIYQQALADLDARERTVALLRWDEGFSFEQIAQALGVTKMGARHILLRAERKVQRRLAEYRP